MCGAHDGVVLPTGRRPRSGTETSLLWEAALKIAHATGYWADVDACAHVIDAFHNKITDVINSGAFSGVGGILIWV
jgi:hypothetical protein